MEKQNSWIRSPKMTNDNLYIYECGYEDAVPREPYQYEEIDFYLIHYITKGQGILVINNKVFNLSEGEGFVIPPNTKNNYYPLPGNPWSYQWVGVKGSDVETILNKAGLLGETQNYIWKHFDIDFVSAIFSDLYNFFVSEQYLGALGKFFEIANVMVEEYKQNTRQMVNPEQKCMFDMISFVENNYKSESFRTTDIAESVDISRSHMYKLFMKYLSMSPKDYLTKFRIEKAVIYLKETDLKIMTISNLCGFSNYSQFSKLFTSHTGISPSKFRKNIETI